MYVSTHRHMPSSHFAPLFLNHQELCAEAQSVSPEELGEDEGETGAAEERGGAREGPRQLVFVHALGRSDP